MKEFGNESQKNVMEVFACLGVDLNLAALLGRLAQAGRQHLLLLLLLKLIHFILTSLNDM
jgi:hypothetical protein